MKEATGRSMRLVRWTNSVLALENRGGVARSLTISVASLQATNSWRRRLRTNEVVCVARLPSQRPTSSPGHADPMVWFLCCRWLESGRCIRATFLVSLRRSVPSDSGEAHEGLRLQAAADRVALNMSLNALILMVHCLPWQTKPRCSLNAQRLASYQRSR